MTSTRRQFLAGAGVATPLERLSIQVLGAGEPLPTILHAQPLGDSTPSDFTFEPKTSPWALLRITDLDQPSDSRTAGTEYATFGKAVAYTSPWFFTDMKPEQA